MHETAILTQASGAPVPAQNQRVAISVGKQSLAFNWGRIDAFGTPSYWVDQARQAGSSVKNRIGDRLVEEVVACILGGYGISAESGLRAYVHLKESNLIRTGQVPTTTEVEFALREVAYRFARQRSRRICSALQHLQGEPTLPVNPKALRDWLQGIDGVGPKTASWIVRNYLDSDEVGIIDIHVQRAGLAAGFFRSEWVLPRDYDRFEDAFLLLAHIGAVRASVLDHTIWSQMRRLGRSWGEALPIRIGESLLT